MDTPYYVRESLRNDFRYELQKSSDDTKLFGNDLVFLHRICDLLNKEEHEREGR